MNLAMAHATGSAGAMGRAHGEAAAQGISDAMTFYRSLHPERIDEAFRELSAYIDTARTHLPHLVEEMAGIAEGAGADFEEVAFLNCVEEVFEFEACTTMATPRFLLHAEQWYAGHGAIALVIAEPEDGPAFVGPTCAGVLPAVGMNAAGLAQGIDSLYTTDDRVGIPRVLISSLALRARSLTDAMVAASIDPRAGGYAHVLATGSDAVIVESTATMVRALEGRVVHTNHALEPGLPTEEGSAVSRGRLERATELLAESPPATVEAAMRILADHGGSPQAICHHAAAPGDTATVFGMVCDLHDGTVYVSAGQPCEAAWREVKVPGFRGSRSRHVG